MVRKIAEIATIVACVVAALSYFKIEPNILDEVPFDIKGTVEKDVESFKIELQNPHEDVVLKNLYLAAKSIDNDYRRDDALKTVITKALDKSNFNYALIAGSSFDSEYTKSSQLQLIVESALRNEKSAGYAIAAADLIPNEHTKDRMLQKIIVFYEQGGKAMPPKPLTALDHYEHIYKFADASNYMGMSGTDAKKFADDWLETKSYEYFLYFKDVYVFADSSSKMNMSESEAKQFSLDWVKNYDTNDFEVFKQAFLFADSSNNMGMSEEEATKFAIEKVLEHRKSITPSQELANKAIKSDS